MDNMKRFVSMLLCFVMVLGFLPAGVLAVDASETPVDALVVFSDLHIGTSGTNAEEKQTLVNGVMTAISKDYTVSSVNSAGDMYSSNESTVEGTVSTVSDWIDDVFADADINYVWTDHDRNAEVEKTSGLIEYENYYIYKLSMGDLCSYDRYGAGFNYTESDNSGRVAAGFTATVPQAIAEFQTAVKDLDKTKPLFIVSHQPLFDNRNDNAWAEDWFDAINAVAAEMDVTFFFGHNHNYDNASDYYYAKGSELPVATADNWGFNYETKAGYQGYLPSMDLSSESKTLNFTHISAGYMDPETGKDNANTRMGTALAVAIYDDEIVYTTYDSNGVYTGNYAVNEPVTRAFAAKPETSTPETTAPAETTAPTKAPELDLEDPRTATGTATEPYYTIELHDKADDGTLTLIEAPMVVKEVVAHKTINVWAVVKCFDGTDENGTDLGDLADDRLLWTVSNENIATINRTTGEITFTGKEYGTFQVTVHYLSEDDVPLCSDTITISATEGKYIVPGDGTDDFPSYPDEGAVRFDKTAEAVGNFSQTGTAKVELSMTGVPIKKGTDVIIMLDTSSSMNSQKVTGTNKTRLQVLEESLTNLIAQLQTKDAEGNYMDINVAIADFNGYYGDNSGGTSNTPYDRTSGDYVKDGRNNGSGYRQPSAAKVYTGSKALNANAFVSVGELAPTYTLNYTSGTNYDYAFDAIAQMATAVQDKNAENGESRELVVIFMSDGAALQWNYFGTQNGYDKWNNWLAGTWRAADLTTNNLNSTTHSYYYEMDADGDGQYNEHRMASAIKGSPDDTFEVIRKNQNRAENQDSLYKRLTSTGKDNLYTMKGLGATMYTINFDAQQDGNITEASIDKALSSTASDSTGTTQYYYKVTSADELDNAFRTIGHAITYAATNVVVEDKIADNYTVAFKQPTGTNAEAYAELNGEFYMQVVEYQLDPVTHERTNNVTVLENFTFYSTGNFKSHTVNGVVCENCTHVQDGPGGRVVAINGAHFTYTCAEAKDANGNVRYNEFGDVITEEYITWKADRLSTTELALQYFAYLDNSAGYIPDLQVDPGTYNTNEYANLTYENYKGNMVQQEFPIPQMTWYGAHVTYVFYLVNEAGEPVNRAGRVIPFAEAVYVTDPVTFDVVWNEDNAITELKAEYLAYDLVPDVYALYDNEAYYEIQVYATEGVDGENGNNFNHFIIEGSNDESLSNKNTTKVFNTKAGTKYDDYGAYSNTTGTYISAYSGKSYTVQHATAMDYANTTVAFAVVWKPELVPDVVVVDYGLDVVVDVTTNDSMASGVVGVRTEAPANVTMNSGTYKSSKAHKAEVYTDANKDANGTKELNIGTASVENLTSVRFSLNKDNGMQFNQPAVFYYESDVNFYNTEGDLLTTSMYSSVTVIPATTIYYEDSFVDLTVWDMDDNLLNEQWGTAGEAVNATQAQDRPGASKISEALDADNNYGYDSAYDAMSEFSLGSARVVTVDNTKYAEAQFTFYGTGFDLISLTSSATGTIYVDVYNADDFASNGYNATAVKSGMVDTYYGYTKNENGEWVVTPDNDALYQVPVAEVAELTYGHYTAVITVAYAKYYDHVDAGDNGSYDFYLDAIRIYDPANDGADDEVIEKAYKDDGEGWPSYIELRNALIAASSFGDTNGDKVVDGMVFIDGDPTVGTANLEDYIAYGPNNEVYLGAGQSVAFLVDAPTNLAKVQIGIKSADGSACSYSIKNVTSGGLNANAKDFTVSTATDMYYDLTGWVNDIIVISNTGTEGIISITNIKSTYTSKPTTTEGQEIQGVAETSIYMTAKAAQLVLNAKEPEAVKPEPVNPFADVQKADFYYDAVLWAVENGVTNGVDASHFGPYLFCNRAQVVTFLWRAAGSPAPVSRNNPFTDVPADSWYTDAVLWAVENGITNGLTATTFGPDAQCNRAQVVTFLWRANGSKVTGAANPFADVPADAFYHDAVIWALSNGITTGASANAFDPEGTCMRAHVVTFLYRAEQLPELSES